MWPILQESAYLVTFTEEIRNGKLHFLCSDHTDNANGIHLISDPKTKIYGTPVPR